MINGFFTIILDVLENGWTMMNHQSTFQSQISTLKRLKGKKLRYFFFMALDHTLERLCWKNLVSKKLSYEVLPHPPSSPDLAPTYYHLFIHLERFLENKIFNDDEEVNNAVNESFNSKQTQFFCNGIDDLSQRWKKFVESDGNYFD